MADGVDAEARFRGKLALSIVLSALLGIFTVSGVAIGLVGGSNREQMIRLVFASIIPLLGTWVGTVLAFYFARESLQAATDSTVRLMGRNDPQTPVQQVMIPKGQILAKSVAAGSDPKGVMLTELMSLMQGKNVHRIPIFDASGAVLFIVHDSTINAFISGQMRAGVPAPSGAPTPSPAPAAPSADPLTGKTLGNVLDVPEFEKMIKAIAIVGPNATVGGARTAMMAVEGCNDVFVTSNGRRTDPVEGWLTNTDLAGFQQS